jgi:hypothetical protein
MADFNAVASAIATRFGAATAPSGETAIRLASATLPNQIPAEPVVLVYPPTTLDFTYNGGVTSIVATYPVRFFLWRTRDKGRNAVLINKWLGALYRQLAGQAHLGLSSYVNDARIESMGAASLSYGGEEFDGITIDVEVHIWEASEATA